MPTGTDKKKSSLIKGTEKAVPSKTENLYIIANLLQPNTSLTCTKKNKRKLKQTNKTNLSPHFHASRDLLMSLNEPSHQALMGNSRGRTIISARQ